jgi:hypothetical protein
MVCAVISGKETGYARVAFSCMTGFVGQYRQPFLGATSLCSSAGEDQKAKEDKGEHVPEINPRAVLF